MDAFPPRRSLNFEKFMRQPRHVLRLSARDEINLCPGHKGRPSRGEKSLMDEYGKTGRRNNREAKLKTMTPATDHVFPSEE